MIRASLYIWYILSLLIVFCCAQLSHEYESNEVDFSTRLVMSGSDDNKLRSFISLLIDNDQSEETVQSEEEFHTAESVSPSKAGKYVRESPLLSANRVKEASHKRKSHRHYSAPKSECAPIANKRSVRIAPQCKKFKFNFVECNGYCESQSMIWNQHTDIKVVLCCSMYDVVTRPERIYCSTRIDTNEITNDAFAEMRDDEVYSTFKEAFDRSTWTDEKVFSNKTNKLLYSGYFTVSQVSKAKCKCTKI